MYMRRVKAKCVCGEGCPPPHIGMFRTDTLQAMRNTGLRYTNVEVADLYRKDYGLPGEKNRWLHQLYFGITKEGTVANVHGRGTSDYNLVDETTQFNFPRVPSEVAAIKEWVMDGGVVVVWLPGGLTQPEYPQIPDTNNPSVMVDDPTQEFVWEEQSFQPYLLDRINSFLSGLGSNTTVWSGYHPDYREYGAFFPPNGVDVYNPDAVEFTRRRFQSLLWHRGIAMANSNGLNLGLHSLTGIPSYEVPMNRQVNTWEHAMMHNPNANTHVQYLRVAKCRWWTSLYNLRTASYRYPYPLGTGPFKYLKQLAGRGIIPQIDSTPSTQAVNSQLATSLEPEYWWEGAVNDNRDHPGVNHRERVDISQQTGIPHSYKWEQSNGAWFSYTDDANNNPYPPTMYLAPGSDYGLGPDDQIYPRGRLGNIPQGAMYEYPNAIMIEGGMKLMPTITAENMGLGQIIVVNEAYESMDTGAPRIADPLFEPFCREAGAKRRWFGNPTAPLHTLSGGRVGYLGDSLYYHTYSTSYQQAFQSPDRMGTAVIFKHDGPINSHRIYSQSDPTVPPGSGYGWLDAPNDSRNIPLSTYGTRPIPGRSIIQTPDDGGTNSRYLMIGMGGVWWPKTAFVGNTNVPSFHPQVDERDTVRREGHQYAYPFDRDNYSKYMPTNYHGVQSLVDHKLLKISGMGLPNLVQPYDGGSYFTNPGRFVSWKLVRGGYTTSSTRANLNLFHNNRETTNDGGNPFTGEIVGFLTGNKNYRCRERSFTDAPHWFVNGQIDWSKAYSFAGNSYDDEIFAGSFIVIFQNGRYYADTHPTPVKMLAKSQSVSARYVADNYYGLYCSVENMRDITEWPVTYDTRPDLSDNAPAISVGNGWIFQGLKDGVNLQSSFSCYEIQHTHPWAGMEAVLDYDLNLLQTMWDENTNGTSPLPPP